MSNVVLDTSVVAKSVLAHLDTFPRKSMRGKERPVKRFNSSPTF